MYQLLNLGTDTGGMEEPENGLKGVVSKPCLAVGCDLRIELLVSVYFPKKNYGIKTTSIFTFCLVTFENLLC